jgi:hypothetical protein
MDDPQARYGLALPDNRQFRGLVQRLPKLAWIRLNLTVFIVKRLHDGYEVEVISDDREEPAGNGARKPDDRPRCAACGEPVVLDDSADPDSWIHAPDANDRADHTAWIEKRDPLQNPA